MHRNLFTDQSPASNHQPSIIENIPLTLNKRLSEISSDKHLFDIAAVQYQEALVKSGYQYQLNFQPNNSGSLNKKRCRNRRVTWFSGSITPFVEALEQMLQKSS